MEKGARQKCLAFFIFATSGFASLPLAYRGWNTAAPFPAVLGWQSAKAVIGGGNSVKEFAEQFYSSKAWQRTRKAYAKSKQNLCEICLSKGIIKPCEIVHHKIELTPDNINDPSATLNWDNLQCVCRDCHANIHDRSGRRWKVDELGRVSAKW